MQIKTNSGLFRLLEFCSAWYQNWTSFKSFSLQAPLPSNASNITYNVQQYFMISSFKFNTKHFYIKDNMVKSFFVNLKVFWRWTNIQNPLNIYQEVILTQQTYRNDSVQTNHGYNYYLLPKWRRRSK